VAVDRSLEQRVSDCLHRAVSDDRLVGGVVLVARNGEAVVEIVAGLPVGKPGGR
jgi:hypothetical protein